MANYRLTLNGDERLQRALNRLGNLELEAIQKKQLTQLLNRARAPGGTPVDTGELRKSSVVNFTDMTMGYTKEYAPHVEYGHRTINGGYVQGQRFLQSNVETQQEIYRKDVLKAIRKGKK